MEEVIQKSTSQAQLSVRGSGDVIDAFLAE